MAFVTIGLFAMNRQGIEGGLIVMLSHGLVSGALFLCVGVVYDRMHTREIDRYGGLANNMPFYSLFLLLFTMAAVGLPGTSGFVGEFLALLGSYRAHSWVAFVATTGIILGAAYMLYLYWRIAYGTARTPEAAAMPDLTAREWGLLAPIAAVVLWMGVYPRKLHGADAQGRGNSHGTDRTRGPAGDAQLEKGAGMPKGAHGRVTAGTRGSGSPRQRPRPTCTSRRRR
jgi:NADH-quinone oxidoreductase subunit M